jgi:hypothetical protein
MSDMVHREFEMVDLATLPSRGPLGSVLTKTQAEAILSTKGTGKAAKLSMPANYKDLRSFAQAIRNTTFARINKPHVRIYKGHLHLWI